MGSWLALASHDRHLHVRRTEAFAFSLWLGPRETWGPLASKLVWASEQIKVGRSFGD